MIIWIIFGAIFLIIVFVFLNVCHIGKKIKVIVLLLIGILLFLSISTLLSNSDVNLTSPGGIAKATYIYFGWVGKTIGNLWEVGKDTVSAVGNAIRFNNTG